MKSIRLLQWLAEDTEIRIAYKLRIYQHGQPLIFAHRRWFEVHKPALDMR